MKLKKKIFAVVLAIVMIIPSISLMSFAFENEEEFNIRNVTWNDIMTMSNEEFRDLLSDFERVYDPFGTYEESSETQNCEEQNLGGVDLQWKSGKTKKDGELESVRSHELITARACGIVFSDKGFWCDGNQNEGASIIIALMISLASAEPDNNPTLGSNQAWKGHFYDPDTGMNFAKETNNTAKTNAVKYYNAALSNYRSMTDKVMTEELALNIGRTLHYVQDACEPHHAANITALKSASHGMFESYADERMNEFIDPIQTMVSSSYTSALNSSVGDIVHDGAVVAKGYSDLVDNIFDKTHWGTVAKNTSMLAVYRSAMVVYKLYYNTKF